MPAKRLLFLLLLFSGLGHGLILALIGLAEPKPSRTQAEFFSVSLVQEEPRVKHPPEEPPQPPPASSSRRLPVEKTISLSEIPGSRYAPYVGQVKSRIMKSWKYPAELIEREITGIVVLRFTIEESGKLVKILLEKSSGREVLDRNALDAVSAAAPFTPLPGEMRLARLHIVAQFNYLKAR